MQHAHRPILPLALAALLGLAAAAAPGSASAQGHGHAKGKAKASKSFDRTDDVGRDDRDDGRQPGRQRRGVGPQGVPPGQMPPAGMCRIWIDGVPPGRQPAPTDCATAERNRPSNARVVYGSRSRGAVSHTSTGTRTVVRRDTSCADVNGDGRRERVAYVVDGRVVRTECR